MKKCEICGCLCSDNAVECPICGVRFPASAFPAPSSEPTRVAPVSSPVASGSAGVSISFVPSAPRRAPDTRRDRYAIAGFVLSLIGALTCLSTPLQAVALILSAVGTTKRYRGMRLTGLILSCVSLVVSLVLWIVVAVFYPQISDYLSNMNFN